MPSVLFLCSGNYYRSRFAEIYFNHEAARLNLAARAESRGFRLHPGNVGPISRHTLEGLARLGLAAPDPLRSPQVLTVADLEGAARIVAVKEAEHRPMMLERFPTWVARTEFWHIDDVDCAEACDALPQLQRRVDHLLHSLS